VHQECLLRWISRAEIPDKCEVCHGKFEPELIALARSRYVFVNTTARSIMNHYHQSRELQISREIMERQELHSAVQNRLKERKLARLEAALESERAGRMNRDVRAEQALKSAILLMNTALMGGGCTAAELNEQADQLRLLMEEFEPKDPSGRTNKRWADLHDWALTLSKTAADGMLTRTVGNHIVSSDHTAAVDEGPGAEGEDPVTCCPLDPILEEVEELEANDTQTEALPPDATISAGVGRQEGNVISQGMDVTTGEGLYAGANWSCGVCTYLHEGEERSFLKCAMCGSFQAAVADLATHDSDSTPLSAPSQEPHIDASSQEDQQDQNV